MGTKTLFTIYEALIAQQAILISTRWITQEKQSDLVKAIQEIKELIERGGIEVKH